MEFIYHKSYVVLGLYAKATQNKATMLVLS